MPKVSIIVPVYNGEERLERCAYSILDQDFKDLELILVDDGSRDNSIGLMRELAHADSRVIALHKENGGVSSARNAGLELASGEYIQFCDVDDWVTEGSTKLLVEAMERDDTQMVIADFTRVMGSAEAEKGAIKTPGVISRRKYADEMMLHPADLYYGVLWNKLYRRDIIEKHQLRMDENISLSEDMIFNLEYLIHVNSISVVKESVYNYNYTKGSLVEQSFNPSKVIRMKTQVIEYYNEFFKQTFDIIGYEERKPLIYGYLLAVGTDSLALPSADELVKDIVKRIH